MTLIKYKPSIQKLIVIAFIFISSISNSQDEGLKKLTVRGYAELYYGYDFSKPSNHERPNFLYNHKRHNELNANFIVAQFNYKDKAIRANLGIMVGNYSTYNLRSEPAWAKLIYEANIGIKLSKTANLWMDAGILPSHIGFESAISADCWTLTRSLVAENSPYFETGIKIGYQSDNKKLSLALSVLNGWQRIQRPNYIQKPSFGIQVNYKPNEKMVLNYSNFIGSDKPDSLNALRTFHNFYMQYDLTDKFGFIAGFDLGTDKLNTNDYGLWFSQVLIARYALSDKYKVAIRGEYYNDKNQILISTGSPNGFQVSGLSVNFDYLISENVQWRIEAKNYISKDKIFLKNSSDNYCLTTNLTIRL